MIVLKAD